MRLHFLLFAIFLFFSSGSAFCLGASPACAEAYGTAGYIELAKDTPWINTAIKDIKKAFSFKKNIREKEKKRIDAILKKYLKGADLISKADIKKINDSLTKKTNFNLDSLGKLIKDLGVEKEKISKQLGALKKGVDSMAAVEPDPQNTAIEMDKLVESLVPMVKEKVKEEEIKEQKEKKIKIVRSLINHPEGVTDTLVLSDSLSKKFTLKLSKKKVFGFHPYWRNSQHYRNYNFSLLSTLVYMGYELNGKTGGYKDLHGWDTEEVIPFAKSEKCQVQLAVFCGDEKEILSFLKNNKAQENFFTVITEQLALKNADGVNFILGSPGGESRLRLIKFIKALHAKLAAANPDYKISLTIPAFDKNMDYDVKALDPYVEYFLIDFTKKSVKGPIAPITGGDFSLESSISRYLNSSGTAAEKFIACLPYHGAIWSGKAGEEFYDYIAYNEIAESYTNLYGLTYDNMTARTDVVFNKVDTVEQLWFDDAKTLSAKYDYVLGKNLSGVGIWTLGDDNGKPELWDALMDKMISIDTSDVVVLKPEIIVPAGKKTLWEKIKYEFQLIKEMFQHPCDFGEDDMEEMKSDEYAGYTALVFIVLLTITGIYTVIKRRSLGDDWPKRKLFLSLLIIFMVFSMIFGLVYFFLNPAFSGFGYSNGQCETSFGTVLKVLAMGFIIGLFAMQLLIRPLIKRKEIP